MKLLGSFAEKAPNTVFVSIVLGALAGAAYTLIIPLVLGVLAPQSGEFVSADSDIAEIFSWQISHYRFALLFVLVCAWILIARTASQVMLMRVSMDVTTDLRTRMYRRIANAPIADLERVGMPRLVASIASDVPVIVAGARLLPDLLTNAVTLVGMLGFLLYLNSSVFWFVMGCIAVGVLTYQVPMLLARNYLLRARRRLDDLHESIRGLVHGAKELKLNHDKREHYFLQALAESENDVRADSKTGHTIMRVAQNYGDMISFFVIGAVAFVFVNYHAISPQELNGVIMVLLYVTGPVSILLNFIPQYAMAHVALRKVNQLFSQLPHEDVVPDNRARRDWRRMRFDGVVYQYPERDGEAGFLVGPLHLEVRRGEVVFIVGGNGCGKSTLSKLITLHYQPTGGAISFDDEVVDAGNLAGFRRSIAAIYSDYYLFDRAYGIDHTQLQGRVDEYLSALGLAEKVKYKDGRFSTLALSDGQKRRLALLIAFLEDAELYLFDEWAADQDPVFKAVFYKRILPELREKDKAVVVISHDDRYFDVGDRVIEMSEGRICSVSVNADSRPAQALLKEVAAPA
jgi:putative ATP-binding cassette transporter